MGRRLYFGSLADATLPTPSYRGLAPDAPPLFRRPLLRAADAAQAIAASSEYDVVAPTLGQLYTAMQAISPALAPGVVLTGTTIDGWLYCLDPSFGDAGATFLSSRVFAINAAGGFVQDLYVAPASEHALASGYETRELAVGGAVLGSYVSVAGHRLVVEPSFIITAADQAARFKFLYGAAGAVDAPDFDGDAYPEEGGANGWIEFSADIVFLDEVLTGPPILGSYEPTLRGILGSHA